MSIAFITGGAGGLGQAICARAATAGYRVCVVDRELEAARVVASRFPSAIGIEADVTDEASVEAALDAAGGVPDLVVNNAGIARFGPLLSLSLGDFRAVIDVNLVGCYVVARAAARRMAARGSGAIVNITSIGGIAAAPNVGAYAPAKAGLAHLTELMSLEWGPLGIRVNAVAPGFIDAGLSAPFFKNPAIRELRGNAVPTRRLGTAEDVANAVVWLGSAEASYVNGHELVVDGGVVNSVLAHLPREPQAKA